MNKHYFAIGGGLSCDFIGSKNANSYPMGVAACVVGVNKFCLTVRAVLKRTVTSQSGFQRWGRIHNVFPVNKRVGVYLGFELPESEQNCLLQLPYF